MRQPKPRGCDQQARQNDTSKTPKEDLGKRGSKSKGLGAAQ